jgi:hypothetical protein
MALCLFGWDSAEEVAQKVTGSLSAFGVWDAAWTPPTSSGITQARNRLGRDVLRETFYRVAEPVAQVSTRGAWLGGRRLVAIDGFDLDVPDTVENAGEFGYAGNARTRSAFPKVRVWWRCLSAGRGRSSMLRLVRGRPVRRRWPRRCWAPCRRTGC